MTICGESKLGVVLDPLSFFLHIREPFQHRVQEVRANETDSNTKHEEKVQMISRVFAVTIAAFVLPLMVSQPAQARKAHHRHVAVAAASYSTTPDRNGEYLPIGRQAPVATRARVVAYEEGNGGGGKMGISHIPNPPGTWRVSLSCAHRLAAYFGLGHGLDAVGTWSRRFARASGPGPRVAVVQRGGGHIVGIVGGGPGAWRVVDFNGDGYHGNLTYTIAHVPGGPFLDLDRPIHVEARN